MDMKTTGLPGGIVMDIKPRPPAAAPANARRPEP
jgi:hypothetical protein